MPDRVRIAVAGAGAFGREHLQRLAAMPEVEMAGIADSDREAARNAAGRFGIQRVESDARELIARKPDGLIVATPGPTHVPIAIEALRAGVPVLVEKPVAMNLADAEKLAEAEAKSSAFVLPGHVLRFSKHHQMLLEIARSAEIGTMLSFTSRRHRDDAHATRYVEVDPVLMTMVHDIDLALWFTGAGITAAHAVRQPPGEARSDTMMTAAGARGVTWHLHAAWTFAGSETPPDRVEIVGERGGVELESGTSIRQFGASARTIDLSTMPEDPLAEELATFVTCIRSGQRPRAVTIQDACAGLAVADAVLGQIQ